MDGRDLIEIEPCVCTDVLTSICARRKRVSHARSSALAGCRWRGLALHTGTGHRIRGSSTANGKMSKVLLECCACLRHHLFLQIVIVSTAVLGHLEKACGQAWLGLDRQEGVVAVVAWLTLKPRSNKPIQALLLRFAWASGFRKHSGLLPRRWARSAKPELPLPRTYGSEDLSKKIKTHRAGSVPWTFHLRGLCWCARPMPCGLCPSMKLSLARQYTHLPAGNLFNQCPCQGAALLIRRRTGCRHLGNRERG